MKLKIAILFLLITTISQAQLTVNGKVIDENNQPLPFVNVILKGTTIGTVTDDSGVFSITYNKKKRKGTLEFSFVGYISREIKINSKRRNVTIVLKEDSNELEEVVVVTRPKKRLKKKENPAYKILKEIWKRKRRNGLALSKYYQFKKHTTTEIGLNNLDTVFIKNLFGKQYQEAMDNVKYDSDGINYYIPIFITETVQKVYGDNINNQVRTDMEAEKKEGLTAKGFIFDRMSLTFRNIDVFKNNITLLNKSFVSPISSDGFATYDYVLYDSIVKNDKKFYNIFYFPLRNGDLAFTGNFLVDSKNYSLSKIRMKTQKGINLNFVRGLTMEKEFEVRNDSLYIEKTNRYNADFTFLDKNENNRGLTIKKTENFNTYILDKALDKEFYATNIEKYRPDQFTKDENYWLDKQSNEDKTTYKIIKSVKEKKSIKKITGIVNTISTGYINLGKKIQVGPLWTALSSNEIEGFKTRLAFRTFNTLDDRFRLKSFLAYGFKDKKFKYGAEASYLLSYKPRITTSVAYQKDIEQLGSVLLNTTQLLGRSFGTNALFNRGNNFFLSNVEKTATNINYAINPNFHVGVNFIRENISSASPENFSMDYLDENGTQKSSITNVTSDIYMSYTPGRFVYGLGVEQRYGRNVFPTIVVNYKRGYKDFLDGTHNYHKLQFLYKQPILLGKFGLLDATIEGGKTFGTVPIGLLSPVPANQSFSLVRNTFSLLNYYDFVTDTYAATHLEHHFNGFILNRIPLLKKLKLRSLVTFRAAYGSISTENTVINNGLTNSNGTPNILYNSPNKLYYEYGFGIENIGYGNLRFLRVDAIWRSKYTPPNGSIAIPTPEFAIRIGIRPGL